MTTRRLDRVDELFEQALARSPDERSAWLASACADDPVLRRQVAELLEAHAVEEGILDRPVRPSPPSPARRIGAYRAIRELGRGGMGVVYLAERDDGHYTNRVAVKLLRASPDADELHRRFLAERQILASLVHPNIAQLLDGGVTDGRVPYLVMEYVNGMPITTYCDRHRLTINDRLRLFQDVCKAVHHAHQNLIIHRDIKPGNILVTGDGQVKLLDFGIAKLLNPGMSAVEVPVTRTELRIMTPEYASPEQFRGDPLSTASDVYALGVVLYETLTGRRPYRITSASPAELAHAVCEQEPDMPSTAITRSAEGAPSPDEVSAARNTTPERLRSELRGDLDAIVLMAMRKEPGRRYGSAALFAQDIENALTGMPVLAHNDSRSYRARKFLRRHRVVVAAGAIVALSLLAGTGVAAWQAQVASRQRDIARQAAASAENQRRQSEEVANFLFGLFEASDPIAARNTEGLSARELLERGRARVAQLSGQPLVQAHLMDVLARIFTGLGEYERARDLLEQALANRQAAHGDRHLEVATAHAALGEGFRRLARYDEAIREVNAALALQRELLGPEHPDLAPTLMQLSGLRVYVADLEGAARLAQEALTIREKALGPMDSLVAKSLMFRSGAHRRLGEYAEAERTATRALRIVEETVGTQHLLYASALMNLGWMLEEDGVKLDEAESLYRRALAIRRAQLGPGHRHSVDAFGNLVGVLALQGRHVEADSLWNEYFALMQSIVGPVHPALGEARGHRALQLARSGRVSEGEALARDALAEMQQTLGPTHTGVGWQLGNLGAVLLLAGKLDEAEQMFRASLEVRQNLSVETRENLLVGLLLADIGSVHARRGNYAQAESLIFSGYDMVRRHVPDHHLDARKVRVILVDLYTRAGRPEDAAKYRY